MREVFSGEMRWQCGRSKRKGGERERERERSEVKRDEGNRRRKPLELELDATLLFSTKYEEVG